MRSWRDFGIGIAVGVGAVAAMGACYFLLGFAPVAVGAHPMPLENFFAHAALSHAREQGASMQSPFAATESNLLEGARNYRSACAACHGLPGIRHTQIQQGMYPQPPALLSGKGVTDDPVGETHWVIRNGIRMTGMPSFDSQFSDEQLWSIALLLSHAHDLPPTVAELLKQPDSVPVEAAKDPGSNTGSH